MEPLSESTSRRSSRLATQKTPKYLETYQGNLLGQAMYKQREPLRFYNLVELEEFVQEECMDDTTILPSIDTFTFLVSTGHVLPGDLYPTCNMRLRIGRRKGRRTDASDVFLCLCGGGNNKPSLNVGQTYYDYNLVNLTRVSLEPQFEALCSRRQVQLEVEKKRLKAYACYLYLAAGYIKTIQSYSGFEYDLRLACAWIGRTEDGPVITPRQKAAIIRRRGKVEDVSGESAGSDDTIEQRPMITAPNHSFQASQQDIQRAQRYRRVIESDSDNEISPPHPKKLKLDQIISRMRRNNKDHEKNILALTDELASQVSYAPQFQAKVSQQAIEISNLQVELRTKCAENKVLDQQIKELKQANDKLVSENHSGMSKLAGLNSALEKEMTAKAAVIAKNAAAEAKLEMIAQTVAKCSGAGTPSIG